MGLVNAPRVRALEARGVLVPMQRPPLTASGALPGAALVLLDLHTDAGLTGRAYLFAFSETMLKPVVACVDAVAALLGDAWVEPLALDEDLRRRLRLQDTHGILGQVLAGVDMAAWDVHAQAAGLPLVCLLGATPAPVPAYNSNGGWLGQPAAVADDAQALLAEGGFKALKLRLGHADAALDLATVRAVRRTVGDDVVVMSDYNQALTPAAAIARGRALDDEGLYWIEEPVRHDDYAGTARVAAALNTPVQIGENLRSTGEMQAALAAGAAHYYMPDAQRIGGVSGWLRAASLAALHDVELSSHLFPEVSVHLLAASPTRHWLEYVDWANPVLSEPLLIENGYALVPQRPGNGLAWDEDAVARYRVV